MAISNRERVGKALDLLKDGLEPFVERELKAVHGDQWPDALFPQSKIQNQLTLQPSEVPINKRKEKREKGKRKR